MFFFLKKGKKTNIKMANGLANGNKAEWPI